MATKIEWCEEQLREALRLLRIAQDFQPHGRHFREAWCNECEALLRVVAEELPDA